MIGKKILMMTMKGEKMEDSEMEDSEDSEKESKLDVSKVEKMKTGGNKREITGYDVVKEEDDKSDCIRSNYTPNFRLYNNQNPEIEDFEIGDEVSVTMFVTGMEYRTKEGKVECNVTLSLKER